MIKRIISRYDSKINLAIFIITVIRLVWNFLYGFRWPSEYVLSCTLFTYRDGFIPRGFVGSCLRVLFRDLLYNKIFLSIFITSIGLIILLSFIYLSFYFTIKNHNTIGGILILWYSFSIYSAYIAHEMGYFEQYGFVIIIIAILFFEKISNNTIYIITLTGCMFLSLLVSETNAFLICPVLLTMSAFRVLESSQIQNVNLKKSIFFFLIINVPNVIYCFYTMFVNVSEDQIINQINRIRAHSDQFMLLQAIGDYFLSFSNRTVDSDVRTVSYSIQNWQLMIYMLILIFAVSLVLIFAQYYKEAVYYILSSCFVMTAGYMVRFLGWDVERFKFGQAMMVTFLGIWMIKQVDVKKIIINKDIVYTLVIGSLIMISIMDYRLELFDGAEYNYSMERLWDSLTGLY